MTVNQLVSTCYLLLDLKLTQLNASVLFKPAKNNCNYVIRLKSVEGLPLISEGCGLFPGTFSLLRVKTGVLCDLGLIVPGFLLYQNRSNSYVTLPSYIVAPWTVGGKQENTICLVCLWNEAK